MVIKIELSGAETLRQRFTKIHQRLHQSLQPLLAALAEAWAAHFQDGIRRGGPAGAPWPALHPVTKKIRRYYGHQGKGKLIRGGDLLHSIQPLAFEADAVEVGSRLAYAAAVQHGGGVTDQAGSRQIQAFPFVVVDAALEKLTFDAVEDYFLGAA